LKNIFVKLKDKALNCFCIYEDEIMADSDAEAFRGGLNEFPNLQEGLGCPYDTINKNGEKLCSIDSLPCHLMISYLGPYCDRHGSSDNMDEKAGKTCWAELFYYMKRLNPEERKKIFEEHVIEGNALRDSTRWDSLLYHLREAVVARYGEKAAYTGK
jgi:hypothetical protein